MGVVWMGEPWVRSGVGEGRKPATISKKECGSSSQPDKAKGSCVPNSGVEFELGPKQVSESSEDLF